MTSMVQCDFGAGHPCPKPSEVHGLLMSPLPGNMFMHDQMSLLHVGRGPRQNWRGSGSGGGGSSSSSSSSSSKGRSSSSSSSSSSSRVSPRVRRPDLLFFGFFVVGNAGIYSTSFP